MLNKVIASSSLLILFFGSVLHAKDSNTVLQNSALDIGLTALYLKTYSESLPTNSVNSHSSEFERVNTSFEGPWDWAGILEGSYHFMDRADLILNWMYYSVDYNGTDLINHIGGDNPRQDISRNSGKLKINSVNAEAGQSFDVSAKGTARLSGGVQYLNIKDKLSNSEVNSVGELPTLINDSYQGLGPRVGLDANYKLKGNFAVFANSAATILLARHKQSTSSRQSSSPSSPSTFRSSHRDITIPELEVKLGISVNKPIQHGVVSLAAGWTAINYFNLLAQQLNTSDKNNLTLSGPFLQGKWVG
ncbi:Lpg1974 family pore-forming outer membrane protein [Legionella yabuuchiae]|uniref:Lpg1974 family pore-forming outer membrane protein n=1 Tax=Legionella yabuuchiae TaxID=376727 RepID=UPI0013EFBD1E|nr:Lpg1974 family pore-forming outer membrane protein [Legionella yabuuchiae]